MLLGLTALVIWMGLLSLWGQFWRADQWLDPVPAPATGGTDAGFPAVGVVIPARNEADLLPITVRSHLTQDYPGEHRIVLIDDQSSDGTGPVACQTAAALGQAERLTVIAGQPLPPGWTGKLWAMEQGFRYWQQQPAPPDYLWFTDADIEPDPATLRQLVTQAEQHQLDLTSLMVQLRCESFWEKLLIPAFIFFFQLLYPFPWVNRPQKKTAAAAGGCMLIRFPAMVRIDGLQSIRQALIDDCALGAALKAGGPIWLGLTETVHSLRPYPSLQSIWDMVARTAYTQLYYSPLLLVGTVAGMGLVYLVPPLSFTLGLVWGQPSLTLVGLAGWLLMALAYWPTLKLYRGSPLLALALPLIALLYTLMTLDSAWRHWRGQGGAWKGRVYAELKQ